MTKTREPRPLKERSIQAVIFDLDGVLMNSEWLAFLVWREYIESQGGRLDERVYPSMVGLTAEETAEYLMRQTRLTFDVATSCEWIWRRMSERLKSEIEPLPGSAELVRELARRGYPLAIASNSLGYYIDDALEGLDLANYFPVRAAVDQVANGKPAPDVYLRAADLLGVAANRCLAIEDSRVGMQAAIAAGMRVLAVPAPHDALEHFSSAWKVFPSLEHVRQKLDTLLA